jgi:1,4-dihydroxy-2-naphthoate octaprenyltransferase
MLMAVEFPDEVGDALVGKRTLVVRLGASRASVLYVAALALAYLLLPAWNRFGLPASVALALMLVLPLAVWLGWRVVMCDEHRQRRHWNRLAFGSVSLVTIAALVELSVYVELTASSGH